jgi:hypothetical protein
LSYTLALETNSVSERRLRTVEVLASTTTSYVMWSSSEACTFQARRVVRPSLKSTSCARSPLAKLVGRSAPASRSAAGATSCARRSPRAVRSASAAVRPGVAESTARPLTAEPLMLTSRPSRVTLA